MDSPAAVLRRHQTEVRRLIRSGFTKYALLKTAHEAWREEGRGERLQRRASREREHAHAHAHFLRVCVWRALYIFGVEKKRRLFFSPASIHPVSSLPPPYGGLPHPHSFILTHGGAKTCFAGALTDLANAALLRDQGASHPLPQRIANLPNVRKTKKKHITRTQKFCCLCSCFPSFFFLLKFAMVLSRIVRHHPTALFKLPRLHSSITSLQQVVKHTPLLPWKLDLGRASTRTTPRKFTFFLLFHPTPTPAHAARAAKQIEERILAKRRESLSAALARVKDVRFRASDAGASRPSSSRERASASASASSSTAGGGGGGGGGGGLGSLAAGVCPSVHVQFALQSRGSSEVTSAHSTGGWEYIRNAHDKETSSTLETRFVNGKFLFWRRR